MDAELSKSLHFIKVHFDMYLLLMYGTHCYLIAL